VAHGARAMALAQGRPEPAIGWKRAREGSGRKAARRYDVKRDSDGRKKRINGVNPDPSRSIYRGSTGFARCGSFRRTMRYNGSILIISLGDCVGFVVHRLNHDLNSEFRSSTANKTSSGHPDDKHD
jgi:hypothetical protein